MLLERTTGFVVSVPENNVCTQYYFEKYVKPDLAAAIQANVLIPPHQILKVIAEGSQETILHARHNLYGVQFACNGSSPEELNQKIETAKTLLTTDYALNIYLATITYGRDFTHYFTYHLPET